MVLVDSNGILDILTADPRWLAWSEEQQGHWLDQGLLLINPIVYAEIAFACDTIETVDDLLPSQLYSYRPIPRQASSLAARAHAHSRSRGESRQTVLSRRYKQALPGLRLISPFSS